ncbi:MAG: GDSL-type esterase/lipase family protein [Terriglobales bacterium]
MLWFIGICLFFEVALRPFGYGSYVIYRPDEQLLWVPIPDQHKVTVVNHEPETISSQGFRYKETLSLQHPGVYRIFAFGDSVTMGWGVSDDSIYTAQLERLLNSQSCSGSKFQVISAGVNAYPQVLTVRRLERVLQDGYTPNVVVLAFSFNTGFDTLADLQGAAKEQFLKKVEWKSILRRSALYNFTVEGLLRNWVYYRLRGRIMLGTWDTAESLPNPSADHYIKELQAAKQAADDHHAQLIFLLMGTKGEFHSTHPYQNAMQQFAGENGIPLVNMMDVVKNQNQDAVFLDHVHPTVAGDALIAEQLASTIRGLGSYATACGISNNPAIAAAPTTAPTEIKQ